MSNLIKGGIRDSIVYGFGLLLIRFSSIVILPILTQAFTPSEYAILALILTLLPITRFLLPFEISQACIFFCDAKTIHGKRLYFSIGFWFTVFMNSLVFLLAFLAALISYSLFHYNLFGMSYTAALFVALALLFDSLQMYCLNIIRWSENLKAYTFISIVVAWLTVCLIILNIKVLHFGIEGVFLAWLLSWGMGFILSLAKVSKYLTLESSRKHLAKMLHFTFPLFINNIPANLNRMTDRYVILFFLGLSAVGFYSAAFSIASMATVVTTIVQTALWPTIYKYCKSEASDNLYNVVELFYCFSIFIGLISILLTILNKPLLHLLLGNSFSNNPYVQIACPILIIGTLLCATDTFFPGMALTRKTKYVIITTIISLLINIFVSILLIQFTNIIGVALGFLLSSLVQAYLYGYYSQKLFYLPVKLTLLIKGAVIFTCLECLSIVLDIYTPYLGKWLFLRIGAVALACLGCIVLYYRIGLLKYLKLSFFQRKKYSSI